MDTGRQVRNWMTSPALTVGEAALVGDVCAEMERRDLHHMLVTRDGRPCGVVCSCDLSRVPSEAPVSRFMASPLVVVLDGADVDQAAVLLKEACVGCLPVVSESRVIGIITRGDLRRAGALPPLVPSHCEACGGSHHLRVTECDVVLCVHCREEGMADRDFSSEAELGDGD